LKALEDDLRIEKDRKIAILYIAKVGTVELQKINFSGSGKLVIFELY
jgi:hypothetical protein